MSQSMNLLFKIMDKINLKCEKIYLPTAGMRQGEKLDETEQII